MGLCPLIFCDFRHYFNILEACFPIRSSGLLRKTSAAAVLSSRITLPRRVEPFQGSYQRRTRASVISGVTNDVRSALRPLLEILLTRSSDVFSSRKEGEGKKIIHTSFWLLSNIANGGWGETALSVAFLYMASLFIIFYFPFLILQNL